MCDQIHVKLPKSGAIARIDPKCPKKTLEALDKLCLRVLHLAEKGELPKPKNQNNGSNR